ncbi:hypothetical protein BDQ12DRAFT_371805 [Crucibulum laeve]|uniref:Uncharacterized protein n=1 Tax=Crucibulum laeve TaxID=68775 RepID=A0A5C3LML9_9AGAR|nr:hypothetical protein BDQ12DRAFT_371805 [Crucibulum laeve]
MMFYSALNVYLSEPHASLLFRYNRCCDLKKENSLFILLSIHSRVLGSDFWLSLAILSFSILTLITLPIDMGLCIFIDPVSLTEAFPSSYVLVVWLGPLRKQMMGTTNRYRRGRRRGRRIEAKVCWRGIK